MVFFMAMLNCQRYLATCTGVMDVFPFQVVRCGQMWSDSSQIAMNERLQRHPVCKGCKSQKSWGLDSMSKSIRFLLVRLQLFFYLLVLVANTQSLVGLWWHYIR